nr:DNA mismatch repair protein family [Tanacetum cinerariifolium]
MQLLLLFSKPDQKKVINKAEITDSETKAAHCLDKYMLSTLILKSILLGHSVDRSQDSAFPPLSKADNVPL